MAWASCQPVAVPMFLPPGQWAAAPLLPVQARRASGPKGLDKRRAPAAPAIQEAVRSLYTDELKPYGRILRKRLLELQPTIGSVEMGQLRQLCESAEELTVQEESGGEWSCHLRDQPGTFVDVYSPEDVYDSALWHAAAAYFGNLAADAAPLSGGRYACGLDLKSRSLAFLQGFSLGQICHIVQLAISQKKILGYQGSDVVPYARSSCFRKELCAQRARGAQPNVVSWDLVRCCLRELLAAEGAMVLSNLKRVFQARFQVELSEIALGYAKISEVLRDERLGDICHLRLEAGGYLLVPGPEAAAEAAEAVEEDSDEDADYDAAVSVFHTSHLHDSIRSIECPWGPTPEGSFIIPGEVEKPSARQLATLAEASLSAQQSEEDEDEDYDAAIDMFHGAGVQDSIRDSIRTVDCPWGATPEHSFNEMELQTGADLLHALEAVRLSSHAERPKSEGSTEEGYSSDE